MRSQPLPGEASRRLAKEAADKETASRDAAAAQVGRSEPGRRVRRPQASTPSEPK